MNRFDILIPSLFFICVSCSNYKKDELTIDPSIQEEVESNISESNYGMFSQFMLIYENKLIGEFYEDDKLIGTISEEDNRMNTFKSSYYWRGDTVVIDGAFGLFGGIGFTMKIVNGKATVYHLLFSDDFATYAFNEKDSLQFRLEVPCKETVMVISEIPDIKNKQTIYGYVEFESDDYYSCSALASGKEIKPRKKQRTNMKIFFKSGFLDL